MLGAKLQIVESGNWYR